jgi:hypothetical protein
MREMTLGFSSGSLDMLDRCRLASPVSALLSTSGHFEHKLSECSLTVISEYLSARTYTFARFRFGLILRDDEPRS